MRYALDNYTGVPVQTFAHNGGEYRVFDKPGEGRMMITSSLGQSLAGGVITGATLGGLDGSEPAVIFRRVGEAYLQSSGRSCQVQTVDLVVQPQYELRYVC